jgi:hypothetical protein
MKTTELTVRVARDAGFECLRHEDGVTGVLNDHPAGPLLLFCVAEPLQWEMRGEPVDKIVADGFGLASLIATLGAMRLLPAPPLPA